MSEFTINEINDYENLLKGAALAVVDDVGLETCTLAPVSPYFLMAVPLAIDTVLVISDIEFNQVNRSGEVITAAIANCCIDGRVEKIDFIGVIHDYQNGRLRIMNKSATPISDKLGDLPELEVETSQPITNGAVKSDGGSSDYYKIHLPKPVLERASQNGFIEVKDILRYGLDNDATLFNIAKALFRIASLRRGQGKQGVTEDYDINKCIFFLNDEIQALKDQGCAGYA